MYKSVKEQESRENIWALRLSFYTRVPVLATSLYSLRIPIVNSDIYLLYLSEVQASDVVRFLSMQFKLLNKI